MRAIRMVMDGGSRRTQEAFFDGTSVLPSHKDDILPVLLIPREQGL